MIKTKEQITVKTEKNCDGIDKMFLADLSEFEGKNPGLKMFSHVTLKVGEAVDFHTHIGEFESYYILSGTGLYIDHDETVTVNAGTVTFTPSGKGHGIRNVGDKPLEFIALIVKDFPER